MILISFFNHYIKYKKIVNMILTYKFIKNYNSLLKSHINYEHNKSSLYLIGYNKSKQKLFN